MDDKQVEGNGKTLESLWPTLNVVYYEAKQKKGSSAYDPSFSTTNEFTNLYVKNFPSDNFDDVDLIVSACSINNL